MKGMGKERYLRQNYFGLSIRENRRGEKRGSKAEGQDTGAELVATSGICSFEG